MAFPKRVLRLSQLIADSIEGVLITGSTLIGEYKSAASGARVHIRNVGNASYFQFWDNAENYLGDITQIAADLILTFSSALGNTAFIRIGPSIGGISLDTSGMIGGLIRLVGDVFAEDYIKTGAITTGTMVAATDKNITVTFNKPFPDNAYMVGLGVRDNVNAGTRYATLISKQSYGFTIVAYRTTGTAGFNVDWIAVRTTA